MIGCRMISSVNPKSSEYTLTGGGVGGEMIMLTDVKFIWQ